MKNKNFIIFILSHGRANCLHTIKALKKQGYTGRILILLDNEDNSINKYIENFGEKNIYIFNKKEISKKFDEADNFNNRKTIVYARNACFEVAKKLNIKYFMQFDDDYTSFRYRFFNNKYITKSGPKNLDVYFDILIDFYKSINAKSICIAQGGDFIGGESCGMISNYINSSRKCMNSFLCSIDRPFKFNGRINEDVNTYTYLGSKGNLFLTIPNIALEQMQTQKNKSGMSDIYKISGTYVKSFYSIIYSPNSVKIKLMGFKNNRLHHSIDWNSAVPKIISEDYKK